MLWNEHLSRNTSADLDTTIAAENIDFSEKKKFHEKLRHLRRVRALSDGECVLFAPSLTMTPDERWQAHEQFLRSHDLFTHSEGIRFQTQAGSETSRQAP
jgi:predicted RNA-binding protein Jag